MLNIKSLICLVFGILIASAAFSKPKLISTHKQWSTYCSAGLCWATHEFGKSRKYWVSTAVRRPGVYETSVLPDEDLFKSSDRVTIQVPGNATHYGRFGSTGIMYMAEPWDQLSLASQMRKGSTATATINGSTENISLSGYTAALKKAHTASGIAYDSSIFPGDRNNDAAAILDGGQISVGGNNTASNQSANQRQPSASQRSVVRSGCSDAEINAAAGQAQSSAQARYPGTNNASQLRMSEAAAQGTLDILLACLPSRPDLSDDVAEVERLLAGVRESKSAYGIN